MTCGCPLQRKLFYAPVNPGKVVSKATFYFHASIFPPGLAWLFPFAWYRRSVTVQLSLVHHEEDLDQPKVLQPQLYPCEKQRSSSVCAQLML